MSRARRQLPAPAEARGARGRRLRARAGRTSVVLAAVVPVVLGLAAPTATVGASAARTRSVSVPALGWRSCGPNFPGVECATATVPLDYDDPGGATTSLALARVPAADSAHRIGTLFVNPGGPGGSGVDFVIFAGGFFADRLHGRFDVVGFDPRGVAGSDPLQCFDTNDEEFQLLGALPLFPYKTGQATPYFQAWNDFTAHCLARPEAIRAQMSTADVARDLDLLRQAVGDEGLTYLGFSYGSYIGNTYANLFPRNVRALAIDGVLDPEAWAHGEHIRYDRTSAQEVLQEFFRLCDEAGPTSCAFASAEPSQRRYERLAGSLLRSPLTLPGGYQYSYDFLVADSVSAMFLPEIWPDFAAYLDAFAAAEEGASAARLAGARKALLARLRPPQREGIPYANGLDAYFGNHCADADYPGQLDIWQRTSSASASASRSGPYWWWMNAACATWPVSTDRYTGPWTARTEAPVLVVGNRFDPSTSYDGAVRTAQLLPNSRLLSYAGWGHTAYLRVECVATAVDAYLIDGTLPPKGALCPANPSPFAGSAGRSAGTAWPLVVGAAGPGMLRILPGAR